MKKSDQQKTMDKFVKDFTKLLQKYPEMTVGGDIDGNPIACLHSSSLSTPLHCKLPSYSKK